MSQELYFLQESIFMPSPAGSFQDFYEEGEREMLLAEVSQLRDQVILRESENKILVSFRF